MKIIGITGGIATGKSSVTNFLRALSYHVIDCDVIARNILTEHESIDEVVRIFGDDILLDGGIDRVKLGRIIFHDPEKKQSLNDIVHPKVILRVKEELKQLEHESIVFVDVPLLYEANMQEIMDYIIVVYVRPKVQIKRLMERDSIEKAYAQRKIDSQMSIDKKALLADYVVDNEGPIETTRIQVLDIIRRIENET